MTSCIWCVGTLVSLPLVHVVVCMIIPQLVELYGPEASKHLFRCLVSSVDLTSDGRSYGKDGQQLQMLCQEANALISKPNFVSILCHGFEKQENKVSIVFLQYMMTYKCPVRLMYCLYDVKIAFGWLV